VEKSREGKIFARNEEILRGRGRKGESDTYTQTHMKREKQR
jgi:hypothetical protein